jgi:hypothetical protein
MSKRTALRCASELDTLDDAEVFEGYRDGRANEPEPGDNRSLSYWHGWRNGMVDYGHMKVDDAQAALAADVIKSGWLRRLFG